MANGDSDKPNIEIAVKARNHPVLFVRVRYASMAWHYLASVFAYQLDDTSLGKALDTHGNGTTAVGFEGSWSAVRILNKDN